MIAKLKVCLGILLMLPYAAIVLYSVVFRFDNPSLTGMQLFLENGWMLLITGLPAFAGFILVAAGTQDYLDEDQDTKARDDGCLHL